MKLLLLISLNTLFLISCKITSQETDGGGGENSQIESIIDQAETALREVADFAEEVDAIESLLNLKNSGSSSISSDTKKTIGSIQGTLKQLNKSARGSYKVVKAAREQVISATDKEEIEKAIEQASTAKDKILSYRDKAEGLRDRVKTLAEN